jgi:hypothetical protein
MGDLKSPPHASGKGLYVVAALWKILPIQLAPESECRTDLYSLL